MRHRRGINCDHTRHPLTEGSYLNFAQRLLLAHENCWSTIGQDALSRL